MQRAHHGKSLAGDSASKEPERKPVCLNVESGAGECRTRSVSEKADGQ